MEKDKNADKAPQKKGALRENIEAIVIAVILALFIRTFVVQAFKIPSGSMKNTLLIGDHILVNKFIYGVKVPFIKKTIIPIDRRSLNARLREKKTNAGVAIRNIWNPYLNGLNREISGDPSFSSVILNPVDSMAIHPKSIAAATKSSSNFLRVIFCINVTPHPAMIDRIMILLRTAN